MDGDIMERNKRRSAFEECIHAVGGFLLRVPIEEVYIVFNEDKQKWEGETIF